MRIEILGSYYGPWGVSKGYWESWTPEAVRLRPVAMVMTIGGKLMVETPAGVAYRESSQPNYRQYVNPACIGPDGRINIDMPTAC